MTFTVWFVNYGYGAGGRFWTFEAAVEIAKSKGFDAVILNSDRVIVASWSAPGGLTMHDDPDAPGYPAI